MDAIEMLREDHRKVKDLFERFEQAEDNAAKKQICAEALAELRVHTALEEELFYPAVRRVVEDEEEVDEAEEEHHVAKLLISELEDMGLGDDHFDAKFKVLAESVKHHIEEEESEMIPEAEGGLDTLDLGEKMAERKEELREEMSDGSARRRAPAARSRKRSSGGRRQKSAGHSRARHH